jgi:hypothetical protein
MAGTLLGTYLENQRMMWFARKAILRYAVQGDGTEVCYWDLETEDEQIAREAVEHEAARLALAAELAERERMLGMG